MTILCIEDPTDPKRCQLVAATAALGVATGACTAIPLVCSLMPSEFTKAASAPVEVDFSGLLPGVLQNMSAPPDLEVPPYCYLAESRPLIGDGGELGEENPLPSAAIRFPNHLENVS